MRSFSRSTRIGGPMSCCGAHPFSKHYSWCEYAKKVKKAKGEPAAADPATKMIAEALEAAHPKAWPKKIELPDGFAAMSEVDQDAWLMAALKDLRAKAAASSDRDV